MSEELTFAMRSDIIWFVGFVIAACGFTGRIGMVVIGMGLMGAYFARTYGWFS